MSKFPIFLVGGAIRDENLGLKSKDLDFAVEAPSFDAMSDDLLADGFQIFKSDPEHNTCRAHFPKDDPNHGRLTGDFVTCRKDGPSSDGRHPDFIETGTIWDDLARRDFTVNAMARNINTGEFLDPHNGMADLATRTLRFVGDPHQRIEEDFLRVLRAVRFVITKGFTMHPETQNAICGISGLNIGDGLQSVSAERKRDELNPCFRKDTIATFIFLNNIFSGDTLNAIFSDGLRLEATLKAS
jgi:tRNA nucleotidyltransferase/poly(A) polymerase